jgi:hypothetical protein
MELFKDLGVVENVAKVILSIEIRVDRQISES